MKKKHWHDYLWVWTIVYFALGFFNILFAWLGMIDSSCRYSLPCLAEGKHFVTATVAGASCSIRWGAA